MAYVFMVLFALSLLINIGLGFAASELDRANKNYNIVRIIYLIMNSIMIFVVIGMMIYLFIQLADCHDANTPLSYTPISKKYLPYEPSY